MTPQEALIWEKAYLAAVAAGRSEPAKHALQAVNDYRFAMSSGERQLREPIPARMPKQEPDLLFGGGGG